jgi:hypothetical protein
VREHPVEENPAGQHPDEEPSVERHQAGESSVRERPAEGNPVREHPVEDSLVERQAEEHTLDEHPVDEPPPYSRTFSPDEGSRPPSVVEALPQYTRSTFEIDEPPPKKSFFKRHQRWFFTLVLLVSALIAGTTAGVLQNRRAEPENTADNTVSAVKALAATECVNASIILYQDDTSNIYLTGNLKSGFWNNTQSPSIPAMQLQFSSLPPMPSSNLAAVCFSGSNSSAIVGKN